MKNLETLMWRILFSDSPIFFSTILLIVPLMLFGCASAWKEQGGVSYGQHYPKCPPVSTDALYVSYDEYGRGAMTIPQEGSYEVWDDWKSSCEAAKYVALYGIEVASAKYGVDLSDFEDSRFYTRGIPGPRGEGKTLIIRDSNGRQVGTIGP